MRDASALHTMTVEEYFRFEEDSTDQTRVRRRRGVRDVGRDRSAQPHRRYHLRETVHGRGRWPVPRVHERHAPGGRRRQVLLPGRRGRLHADRGAGHRRPWSVRRGRGHIPSTARIDRGEKLETYRRIPTLRAYLVVDHRRRRVERHWRDTPAGEWLHEEITGDAESPIPVPCLDVHLTLGEIYRRVELPAVHEPETSKYDLAEEDA